MCERAMLQSDAKVNKSKDFMLDKCPLTLLYPGHDPLTVMIDSRRAKQFAKILANRDQDTLGLAIFKTRPVLERQISSLNSSWVPSLHKIGQYVLFAVSDGKQIKVDTSFGHRKKDGTISFTGDFVSLMIGLASSPSQTRLTIFAKRNDFNCLFVADDMRKFAKNTSLIGLAVMSSPNINGSFSKCQLVVLDALVH